MEYIKMDTLCKTKSKNCEHFQNESQNIITLKKKINFTKYVMKLGIKYKKDITKSKHIIYI